MYKYKISKHQDYTIQKVLLMGMYNTNIFLKLLVKISSAALPLRAP